MLARFHLLLARCSQRFPAAILSPHIARTIAPLPATPAFRIAHSPLFFKPFSSLSKLRRNPHNSPHAEFEADPASNRADPSSDAHKLRADPDPSTNLPHATPDAAAPFNNIFTRTAVVGASVGLLTPLYVAAGIGWIWQTYKPSTFIARAAKFAVGGAFLGAAYVNGWTIVTQHIFPFVFNHAEIILPFALANAVVASAWYAIGESTFGLQRMSGPTTVFNAFRKLLPGTTDPLQQTGLPLGGPLVGLLTALTCFPLWEPLSQRLWPQELLHACDSSVLANVYLNFLPVGLGTGALVGLGLHFALAPIFTGRIVSVGGVPLAISLLLVLAALSLGYFYFCRFDYSAWEQRMDADSGLLFWAHSATGERATASDRLLNDTLWFLKGVSVFCNVNSMSNNLHFCFVNKRLLADVLVADAKLSKCAHGSPGISEAIEKSKLLLHLHYRINFKELNNLILQLLRVQHDLRMALSLADEALKADAVEQCTQSRAALLLKIRALSPNADAAVAIDHLLADVDSLETRLIAEGGLSFSQGTGVVGALMSSLRSFTNAPATISSQHSDRKSLTLAAIVILGGIALFATLR